MSGILLVDMLDAEAAAKARTVEAWRRERYEAVLAGAGEHLLDFAERVLRAPDSAWEVTRSGQQIDLSEIGQRVLALLANVERMLGGWGPLFDAGGIPAERWHGVRNRLRDTIVRFASSWPAPNPYGPEFTAALWRADFNFEDGERGRPLGEVREQLKARDSGGS